MGWDENELAGLVTEQEGKKIQVNIAQVKEVMRVLLDLLASRSIFHVWMLLRKHRKG
jgi:hypothetical protein